MDDNIKKMISDSGTIDHPSLYRRWIPIQIFRGCDLSDRSSFEDEFIIGKPYWYQWKTLTDEFKCIRHIKDATEFKTRTQFYNFKVLKSMLADYKLAIAQTTHTDVPEFVNTHNNIRRLEQIIQVIETRHLDQNFRGYEAVVPMLRVFSEKVWMPKDCTFEKNSLWRNAFYGAGIYYTSRYLIEFQDCKFDKMDKDASLRHLNELMIINKTCYSDLYHCINDISQNKDKTQILTDLI